MGFNVQGIEILGDFITRCLVYVLAALIYILIDVYLRY